MPTLGIFLFVRMYLSTLLLIFGNLYNFVLKVQTILSKFKAKGPSNLVCPYCTRVTPSVRHRVHSAQSASATIATFPSAT